MTIEVKVPGAGSLKGSAGKKIAATVPQPTRAGSVRLTLKATGKGIKALSKKGFLKGTLTVTFTPTGGTAKTKSTSVKLIKKRKAHRKHKGA